MSSYWIDSTKNDVLDDKKIDKNYTTDVCIVGAGITGLSTAYYLSKKGLKVIVVDKAPSIGEKASGNTTAKITLGHNLIYKYLIDSFGLDFAVSYYQANMDAIANIKELIDNENINCDFEYTDNYVYSTNQDDIDKIQDELTAIKKIEDNINVVYDNPNESLTNEKYTCNPQFVKECELPFKIAGAIKISNQAQFHPRKYMVGLAKSIEQHDGKIFTNTLVSDVNMLSDGYVTICNEYAIKSKYVVLASHYPFINFPGFYFSKMYQVTSYAMCVETSGNIPDGMYINTGEPALSIRKVKSNDKSMAIVAGGNHKTGYSPESNSNYAYAFLEQKVKELYPDGKILYKWNTRDCVTLDKVAYIGKFSSLMPEVYVATGFNKWGMTTSNIAANIITDCITGSKNKYSEIYDSTRFNPIKNRAELKNMGKQIVQSFVSSRVKIPEEDLSAIQNDNGGIIKVNGEKIGVYKDKDGKVYAVKPICTHLGCLLTWNNVDKTWDCPCHGSRFDYTGKNMYDPAFEDLEKI
ncbi:MAG: FAD-dependent oxidoreductase [Clostridia bacterium]|nr:FAD-dependent oxidoreductase [Clostridia bacterium]